MRAGFTWGLVAGVMSTLAALTFTTIDQVDLSGSSAWIELNLGHSVWPFAAVIGLFVWQLMRLQNHLSNVPAAPSDQQVKDISRLDQLLDVWIQLFIGIGVIWTAVGMRSALQSALGDPDNALTDTAGNVLRDLVDGGILLALSTTIVGAVGGYVMRLIKTISVGAALQAFFAAQDNRQVLALREAAERIEARLQQPDKIMPAVAVSPPDLGVGR